MPALCVQRIEDHRLHISALHAFSDLEAYIIILSFHRKCASYVNGEENRQDQGT